MRVTEMRVTEMRVTNKRAADRKRCWKMVIAVLFATAAVSMSALAGQWQITPQLPSSSTFSYQLLSY